jgi:hypothetical protein
MLIVRLRVPVIERVLTSREYGPRPAPRAWLTFPRHKETELLVWRLERLAP